jgi:hypothetical protein
MISFANSATRVRRVGVRTLKAHVGFTHKNLGARRVGVQGLGSPPIGGGFGVERRGWSVKTLLP